MHVLSALIALACLRPPPPANPLDLGPAPAERFVVSDRPEAPAEDTTLDSPMLAKRAGVMAVLTGASARSLRAAGPGSAPIEPITQADPLAYLHIYSKNQHKVVELAHTQAGELVVYELAADGARQAPILLKQDVIGPLLAGWDLYEGPLEPRAAGAKPRAGATEKLDGPYTPGWCTLDQQALGERLLSGGKTTVDGMTRVLATQELFVRLPRAYDPRFPAGVMVWIDPSPGGQIPAAFHASLDEFNIIAVGAAGMSNSQPMGDRLQLALDCLATVSRKFHVDPRRVYVTGVSGGGRLASIMTGCFPDLFTGGIPIVGVACYENLPTGVGGYWSGGFRKPPGKLFALFKKHPMAVVTGGKDMNQPEIHRAMEVFQRDGCKVKLFEWEDLGHTMPSTARMNEIVSWVDQPAAATRRAAEKAASDELRKLKARRELKPMPDQELAKAVAAITKVGPWTPAAWEALELLPSSWTASPAHATPGEAPAGSSPPSPASR